MIKPLTESQTAWVDSTLASLSMEQCIGQLLNTSAPLDSAEKWLALLERVPVGAISARVPTGRAYRSLLADLQQSVPIPLLVLANMEHGSAEWPDYGTDFPTMMAAGAANDASLMAQMGKATAVEARHLGVNWCLTPNVDLNYNYDNPVTNIRALGDRPDLVTTLAPALIQALQANGVAATAKHFPGDGIDDRDQHLVTTINSLPMHEWHETYGQVWRSVIEAGVWTIMPGHISLPAYQGYDDEPVFAPPATISRPLLEGLLRQELGFGGLIVSDATGMMGFATRLPPTERAPAAINAGIDLYLGANVDVDYPALVAAAQEGRVKEERIQEAARRVLELKARLHLVEQPMGPEPSATDVQDFRSAAQRMADKSITLIRNDNGIPLELSGDASVLTVTVMPTDTMIPHDDLAVFDEELRRRGYRVEHLLNPRSDELRAKASEHSAVFINVNVAPMMHLGTVRIVSGGFGHWGWRALFTEHPHVLYTSFGSPYVAYELPHTPNLMAAYGDGAAAQRAAVKVWLGEMSPQGVLPIQLPMRTVRPLRDQSGS